MGPPTHLRHGHVANLWFCSRRRPGQAKDCGAVDSPGRRANVVRMAEIASPDEDTARRLIEEAGGALVARRPEISATFLGELYAHAVAEDLLRYGVGDLVRLAERAFDFMAERAPGAPKIRCETVALADSGSRKAVTVIEIINDDMPFLLDSVMGELADHRLDMRLVAHPVFGVRRAGDRLAAVGAPE